MDSNIFDVIVIGLGGVGSAAVRHLAADGYRVLGIDQFAPPHTYGSTHGQTRIIRKAYFEHPDYVPLLLRAYKLWNELENDIGRQLYCPTGLLELGPTDGAVLSGVRLSASTYNLPIEEMSMLDAENRFRGVRGPSDWSAILEVDAGYLKVEECLAAHLELARRDGAELLINNAVRHWKAHPGEVQVVTDQATYRAGKLVIAAGPWASQILNQYRIPLRVMRKHVYWYPAPIEYDQRQGFPCFFFDAPEGHFYGFPSGVGDGSSFGGMKIGRHSGGVELDSPIAPHTENSDDHQAVERFLSKHLPMVQRPLSQWQGCYYTMTPDENFIVDQLPDANQVVVIAGLSGHGFKFTPVLGEIAAHMATERTPMASMDFLRLARYLG